MGRCQCNCGEYRCGKDDGCSRVGLFLEPRSSYCQHCYDNCGFRHRSDATHRAYAMGYKAGKEDNAKSFEEIAELIENDGV